MSVSPIDPDDFLDRLEQLGEDAAAAVERGEQADPAAFLRRIDAELAGLGRDELAAVFLARGWAVGRDCTAADLAQRLMYWPARRLFDALHAGRSYTHWDAGRCLAWLAAHPRPARQFARLDPAAVGRDGIWPLRRAVHRRMATAARGTHAHAARLERRYRSATVRALLASDAPLEVLADALEDAGAPDAETRVFREAADLMAVARAGGHSRGRTADLRPTGWYLSGRDAFGWYLGGDHPTARAYLAFTCPPLPPAPPPEAVEAAELDKQVAEAAAELRKMRRRRRQLAAAGF